MSLFWHQLRAEQLTTWRSREGVIFVFLFPPLLFVLLASVFGDGVEDGRRVSSYLVAGLIQFSGVDVIFWLAYGLQSGLASQGTDV